VEKKRKSRCCEINLKRQGKRLRPMERLYILDKNKILHMNYRWEEKTAVLYCG